MPERQSTDDNNPFAPPPEGRPDQPWQPRRPEGPDDDGSGTPEPSAPSDGRWSPRQPGPSQDGFGRGPERQGGQGSQGGPGQGGSGRGPGLRWDPTDPAQRRARYAILAGMWGLFFALFEIPELALLLGALGLYWAISSLRTGPKRGEERTADGAGGTGGVSPTSQPASQPSGRTPAQGPAQGASPVAAPVRAMRTAAISGLVASGMALALVAGGFTLQIVYRDFYECRDDALTQAGRLSCNDLLPKPLRATFGVRE
ncbi:hypothetical protein [Streptomyces sp. NPDC058861]|uniref:hypothetical protein n=1 Tax=Streptomyces sp. NPDC058861 TaxID=3346653 RepID=UPI00368ED0CC